jgi:Concanavalin A-like lectin/glucanases superfamily
MKIPARLLTLALIAVPAVPALAATTAAVAPTRVMRYTFDNGATATGRVAENSGRGSALTIRSADKGTVKFATTTQGRYAVFPAPCAKTATTCPRALLEGTDDADLDPGTRQFRWGASVRVTQAQVVGSSNVVQKGVYDTESQWKMQIGANQGKAQCVVVGRGSPTSYLVRSSVGVADNVWHTIACLRSGATLTVYVDGHNRGHVTIPSDLSISNDKPLRIGGPNFNATSDMYHGQLDDVYAVLG